MKKWPIYSDFSILSHNSGNFGQNEKQVLFSEGGTSGTEPNRFRESSSVMCQNVVYQWSASEHCPTIPFQAHCEAQREDQVDGFGEEWRRETEARSRERERRVRSVFGDNVSVLLYD